jgi:hypothetical protein
MAPGTEVKKGRGGARPHAGRPAKAGLYAAPIRSAEDRIVDHLPQIVDAMIDLALGVRVEERSEDGGARVYQRPPDRQAGAGLLDRIMGKAVERKEITGPEGNILRIIIEGEGM